jgi:tetratricopeptide (TPR) repeat protein
LTAGHLALRRGDLKSAESEFVRASVLSRGAAPEVRSDLANAFVTVAEAWMANGNADHARLDFERALRIEPAHARALEGLSGLTSNAHATPVATSTATLSSAPVRSNAARDAAFGEGERAAGEGNWQRAAAIFDDVVRDYPSFAAAHVGVASASFALGLVDRGLDALGRACELEPDNLGLQVQRGALLLQTGRYEHAASHFRAQLSRNPDSIESHLGLAESYRLAQRPLEAVDVLDRAHQAFPSEPSFIAAIGSLAAELGDRASAATALSALEALAPNHPRTSALRNLLTAPMASTGT